MPVRYSSLKSRALLALGLALSACAALLLRLLPVGPGNPHPAGAGGRIPSLPGVMLWAWERGAAELHRPPGRFVTRMMAAVDS